MLGDSPTTDPIDSISQHLPVALASPTLEPRAFRDTKPVLSPFTPETSQTLPSVLMANQSFTLQQHCSRRLMTGSISLAFIGIRRV